jgi:hypothetical protein
MGLFWSNSKPVVTKIEFKEKVMSHLSAAGWNQSDREKVKMVFAGHLYESDSQAGIDKKEIIEGITVLKKTTDISDERLNRLEEYMNSLAR